MLLTPTPCLPLWVDEFSKGQFKQLRIRLKTVMNIKGEIDEFKQDEDPVKVATKP